MIFDKFLYDYISGISIGYFVVGCACLIFPYYVMIGSILNKCRIFKSANRDLSTEVNSTVPYSEFRVKFLTEYDRANPITSAKAMKEYFEFLSSKIVYY